MQGTAKIHSLHAVVISAAAGLMALPALAQSQKIGDAPEARNMRLVGLQRLAGAQRLPADHPQAGRPLHRLYRPSRRDAGGAQAGQPAQRPGGVQRHVGRRRDRPEAAEIPRAHSGDGGPGRAGRRPDGARLRRQEPAQGRSRTRSICCARSAGRRTKSGTSPIRPVRSSSHGSRAARTPTRTGGNATPALPISCPASRRGGYAA